MHSACQCKSPNRFHKRANYLKRKPNLLRLESIRMCAPKYHRDVEKLAFIRMCEQMCVFMCICLLVCNTTVHSQYRI